MYGIYGGTDMVHAVAALDGMRTMGPWGRAAAPKSPAKPGAKLIAAANQLNALAAAVETSWSEAPEDVRSYLTALAYAKPHHAPMRVRIAGLVETFRLMLAIPRHRTEVLQYLEAQARLQDAIWTALEHENDEWVSDADAIIDTALSDIKAGKTTRVVTAVERDRVAVPR